jgi:hypothetical protein
MIMPTPGPELVALISALHIWFLVDAQLEIVLVRLIIDAGRFVLGQYVRHFLLITVVLMFMLLCTML